MGTGTDQPQRGRPVRRALATLVATLIVIGTLAACSPQSENRPTAIQVTVAGDAQPTITPAPLDAESRQGITEIGAVTGFVAGTPMSIELKGKLPESGAKLTRTYAAPLPDDAVVTFAYWDADFGTWHAVPSTLSGDRRTVTAVVHHFSWWNDFIAGSKSAIGKVVDAAKKAGQSATKWVADAATTTAEALHWSLGNIFTTRVDLPECDFPTPTWVLDTSAPDGVDDPVRFCAGHDDAHPDLLVIKARSNRGYGFPVTLPVDPAWEYNSTDEVSLSSTIDIVGNVDKAIGNSMAELLNNGRYIAAGKEISFGIPASAFRKYSSDYLLELPSPSIAQFITSTIAQQAVAWGADQTQGLLGASIAVAKCWSAFSSATDVGKVTGAGLTCLSGAEESIAHVLGEVLRRKGMQDVAAGKLAGTLVGRISLALAFLPVVISSLDYAAEQMLPRNARALTIDVDSKATIPPPVSDQTVGNLLIPAGACVGWSDSKPIQLVNGQGENFDADENGTGILDTRLIGATDLTGDGTDDAVLKVSCTGTPAAKCCAGRGSVIPTIIALDLAGTAPRLIGDPIMGGDLASSEGRVAAIIYDTPGYAPRLDGKDILTYEAPLYDLTDPNETDRISGWFRHVLADGTWSRTAE
ncbi:MAG: hypothetical protein JSS74_03525 [Actinobacteria bacterium]|nr:hypothetical protein [Actinomycetota bacterium]